MKLYIDRIKSFLNKPYEADFHPLRTIVLITIVTVFILVVFQPFGFSEASGADFFIPLIPTVVGITSGILLVHYPVRRLFRKYFTPGSMTVGKEIVLNLMYVFAVAFLCGIAHVLLSYFYYGSYYISWLFEVFKIIFMSVLLGSPISIAFANIMNRNKALSGDLRNLRDINEALLAKPDKEADPDRSERLVISGTTKESVDLHPDELVYIEACGNYVKVNYFREEKMKQKLLRATIKQVEDLVISYPFVMRCHRAFIVNTRHITSVQGNSQGYRLNMQYTGDEIPVSRAYIKPLKEQIKGNL